MMDASDLDGIALPLFVDAIHADTLDTPWRAHRRTQLIHVSDGVLRVRTETGRWVVLPAHALWLPGGMLHRLSATHPVRFLSIAKAPRCPRRCPRNPVR